MKLTLKAARINKGYSQKEAAKMLGVSEFTLSNYERGKSFPKPPIIEKIEKAYDVKYDDLNFFTPGLRLNRK